MEQVVAACLGSCGRHFVLGEYPLQAFDGQLAHILYGIRAFHDDIHAGETAHGTYIHNIFLRSGVTEPGGHQVLQTMHGGRSYGRFFVGFGDAQVECRKAFILARNIYTRLQVGMIDRKTLNDFHIY